MTQDALHLVLVQDNPTVGDYDGNARIVLDALASNPEADLLIFTECFVSGYPLLDLVRRPSCLAATAEQVQRIRAAVMEMQGPAVLIGAPMASAEKPYNSALLIEPDGNIRVVNKTELPNEDVFFERRTFASAEGTRPLPLLFRGFNLGVMICEDMWHGRVARGLADELADVLIVINGSPYQRDKQAVRLRHARARIAQTGLPLIYANPVGGQDEIIFDGRSFIANVDGTTAEAPAFLEHRMKIVLRREADGRVHVGLDDLWDSAAGQVDPVGEDYQACVVGLRDYVDKNRIPHVFVGVSGGLDSALVLAMAVDALGADRVWGVMMPSPYTSQESLVLADQLMNNLGVHKELISIEPMLQPMLQTMNKVAGRIGEVTNAAPNFALAEENYQSRLRAMCLMGLTNLHGGILLTTGNKSEMSVGYATLYGDMCGGYNPLKSTYKSVAFKMARWRNLATSVIGKGVIPNPIPARIIDRPPSAELAEGQVDADTLGDYEALDFVIHQIVEKLADARTAATRLEKRFGGAVPELTGGADALSYARRISRLIRVAQYKRDQAPVGAKTNPTDYGAGWQYPITGPYDL